MNVDVVRLNRVTKLYGTHRALRDVSLTIGPGEAVGYLGPNGAGKTTTLRLLSGLTRPSEGSVEILGQDPARNPGSALRRVGVLVETPGIIPYLRAADLLDHVATTKGIPAGDRRGEVLRVAAMLSVSDHLDRPMGTLSTGLIRRVLLGAALLGDPEVLLLDEPTLGLDPAGRADLRRLLRAVRREGRTILLSTHLLDDVEEVCDRVLFLRDGVLVGDERVDLSAASAGEEPPGALELTFSDDVETVALQRATGPEERWTHTTPRTASVRFSGGDRRQAEIIAALVRAGLPVLRASAPEPDLARRYMERIGREDES